MGWILSGWGRAWQTRKGEGGRGGRRRQESRLDPAECEYEIIRERPARLAGLSVERVLIVLTAVD